MWYVITLQSLKGLEGRHLGRHRPRGRPRAQPTSARSRTRTTRAPAQAPLLPLPSPAMRTRSPRRPPLEVTHQATRMPMRAQSRPGHAQRSRRPRLQLLWGRPRLAPWLLHTYRQARPSPALSWQLWELTWRQVPLRRLCWVPHSLQQPHHQHLQQAEASLQRQPQPQGRQARLRLPSQHRAGLALPHLLRRWRFHDREGAGQAAVMPGAGVADASQPAASGALRQCQQQLQNAPGIAPAQPAALSEAQQVGCSQPLHAVAKLAEASSWRQV